MASTDAQLLADQLRRVRMQLSTILASGPKPSDAALIDSLRALQKDLAEELRIASAAGTEEGDIGISVYDDPDIEAFP